VKVYIYADMLPRTDLHSCVDGSDTGLLQLAVGLAGDLRLHRPLGSPDTVPMSLIEAAATLRGKVVLKDLPPHNNADRRAFLGLYYLTSVLDLYPLYMLLHSADQLTPESRSFMIEYPTRNTLSIIMNAAVFCHSLENIQPISCYVKLFICSDSRLRYGVSI
jgi:hypothetical protein